MIPTPTFVQRSGRLALAFGGLLAAAAVSRAQSLNYTTPYNVTTLAGATFNTGLVDGQGAAAEFNSPYGIAVDSSGNAFVADSANGAVREVTPAGVVSTLATGFGPLRGIALDSSGNVYVADWVSSKGTSGAIRVISGGSSHTVTTLAIGLVQPWGVAVDSSGNVYVAEAGNFVIRKITSAGTVSTYAGHLGSSGTEDTGTLDTSGGTTGRFAYPQGIAFDSSGNLYVADQADDAVRKVSPSGSITTFAGFAATAGDNDGATSNTATFNHPQAVAVDGSGNVYVTEATDLIREISSGTVSTLAGSYAVNGSVNGSGSAAWFYMPTGIAVKSGGALVIADTDNATLRLATPESTSQPPAITSQPSGATVYAGGTVSLGVQATGANLSYQWYLNGSAINGATANTLSLTNTAAYQAGSYTVKVSNSAGSVTSSAATITVDTEAQLVNLSARAFVGTGSNVLVVGFVTVNGNKTVLLRGIGPTLANYGITNPLGNPTVTLFNSANPPAVIASNTVWGGSAALQTAFQQTGAFSLATNSLDSAMLQNLSAGLYTSQVSGAGSQNGVALAEIYDDDGPNPTSRLVNESARALVQSGQSVLVAGFSISGSSAETVLIRGVGPTLSSYGIPNPLAQPILTIFDGKSNVIATNTGWNNDATITAVSSKVGAFALQNSADTAILLTLQPGIYTAQVSSANAASGVSLAEVYEVR